MSQAGFIRSRFAAVIIAGAMVLLAPGDGFSQVSKWIVDATTDCGTSNPFPAADESIRWYGECRDGRLRGTGTLIWYRDGAEVERNVGTFFNGELHGPAVTSYPDGQSITGDYLKGQRHGDFYVRQKDGSYIQAFYQRDRLVSQSAMTPGEVALWQQGGSGESQTQTTALAEVSPSPQPAAVQAQPVYPPQPAYQPLPAVQPALVLNPYLTQQQQLPVVQPAQYPSYPAYQPQYTAYPAPVAVQPGYIQPAVRLGYADNVNAGQLFVNLFASSGNSAVAPRQAAPQVTYRAPVVVYAPVVPQPQYYAPQPVITYPAYTQPQPQYYAAQPQIRYLPQPQPYAPLIPVTYVYPSGQPVQATIQTAYSPGSIVPQAAVGSGYADALFSKGYQLEQSGRFYEAEQAYQQILLTYPSAPSALLANARLASLRQDVRRAPVQVATTPPPSIASASSLVVAVNSPYPPPSQLPASMLPVYDHGIVSNSRMLYRNVCSRDGLYENNSGWCGVVTRDESKHYLVEVRDISLKGFGTIGITRSTCTGNTFLTWFSRGATIRVPKQCVSVTQ